MKRLIYLAVILLLSTTAYSQYKWDYGLTIGGSNYLGDVGGKELTRRDFIWDMHLNQTNVAIGAYGRYKFSKRLSTAANFTFLQIKDSDALSTNPARRARNMNFRNRIFEFGVRTELTVFYDNDVGGRGYYNPDFMLYVFGGISAFYHNPTGQIFVEGELRDNNWYDLRPWKTEGQESEYETIGVAIPVGVGMYFTFDKTWRVGWELSWRTTFTDYIDDISTTYTDPSTLEPDAIAFVSQSYEALINEINDPLAGSIQDHMYVDGFATKRGDPTHNDSYLSTQFTVGKVIRGRSQFYRKKYSWLKNRSGARRSRAKF
jgi:hypothetical protein